MRGINDLFRRHKPSPEGNKNPAIGTSPPSPTSSPEILPSHGAHSFPDTVSEPGALWYNPRHRHRQTHGTTDPEIETRSHFSHPYDLERAFVPSSTKTRHSKGRKSRNKEEDGYPPRNPKKETGFFSRKKKYKISSNANKATTNILIATLIEGNWTKASSLVESQPELARQQDAIFLHGHQTMAYPLHVACCVQTPPDLFDQILNAFRDGTTHTDEVTGRLPLHWACMSLASNHVVNTLIHAFPSACNSYDLTDSRSPLHFLAIYGTSVDQFYPLLTASPVNHKRVFQHRDKEGKTAVDLARSSTSPERENIVALLVLHEEEALSNTRRRKQNRSEPDVSPVELVHSRNEIPASEMVMQAGMPRGNSRNAYCSVPTPSTAACPTPGAQAAAFAEEPSGERLYHSFPAQKTAKNRNLYTASPVDAHAVTGTSGRFISTLSNNGGTPTEQRRGKEPTKSAFDIVGHQPEPSALQPQPETRFARRPKKDKSPLTTVASDWQTRYLEKVDTFSSGKTDSNVEYNGSSAEKESDERPKPPSRESQNRNSMSAQSMVEGMFLNMRQLEDSIGRLQEDLDQKETDMKNLEIVATDMAMREQDLLLGLENSRSVVLHQYEKVNKKRDTIDLLKDKIATLQAELAKEESILAPMERTILMLEQKVADKEQRLIDHREELASFEAMRQAILQERDGLSRDLENRSAELQSLKVIQGLAHGEDLL